MDLFKQVFQKFSFFDATNQFTVTSNFTESTLLGRVAVHQNILMLMIHIDNNKHSATNNRQYTFLTALSCIFTFFKE